MNLSSVSKTAIGTLVLRAIAAEHNLLNDPIAITCLNNLLTEAGAEKEQILKNKAKLTAKLSTVVKTFANRAKYFDVVTNDFITQHEAPTVINLGCGFDTRFWRINNAKCKYFELDLPEVIDLKKKLLKENMTYECLGYSVLDLTWIDKVTANGNTNFLFLAEGLLPYVSEDDVKKLLSEISKRFTNSQIAFNVVPLKYTKGFWKYRIRRSLKKMMGVDISYVFGVKTPEDIEHLAIGIKIIDYSTIQNVWFVNSKVN